MPRLDILRNCVDLLMNRQNEAYSRIYPEVSDLKDSEDALYSRLLSCCDNLPRATRRAMDRWWIAVLNSRIENG